MPVHGRRATVCATAFSPELADIGGFLSRAFCADTPFTVDYARGVVVVESPATVAERAAWLAPRARGTRQHHQKGH